MRRSASSPYARVGVLLAMGAVTGCVRPRPGVLPPREAAYVAVISGEMPGAFRDVARHSWIVSNVPATLPSRSSTLARYEWLGDAEVTTYADPSAAFTSGVNPHEVAISGVVRGSREEIAEVVSCLARVTKAYKDFNCGCWPGPSSNTFTDLLIRSCGLGIELPATALGKDYRGPIGFSGTEGGTGVQIETWLGGAKIGLKEGIGADFIGLPLGVHFWPPGFDVPVNPGRIGVDTALIVPGSDASPDRFPWPEGAPSRHEHGAGSIVMLASYSHIADRGRAAGLTDLARVGLTGRGVYAGHGRVGVSAGFDLEIGASAPVGVAYRANFYPAGLGVVLGDTGFLAVHTGLGTSRESARFELPEEARLELEVTRWARVGVYGGVVIVPYHGDDGRALESFLGATTRLGTRATGRDFIGVASGGFFIGLERRQVLRTFSLGAVFGYEIGAGG